MLSVAQRSPASWLRQRDSRHVPTSSAPPRRRCRRVAWPAPARSPLRDRGPPRARRRRCPRRPTADRAAPPAAGDSRARAPRRPAGARAPAPRSCLPVRLSASTVAARVRSASTRRARRLVARRLDGLRSSLTSAQRSSVGKRVDRVDGVRDGVAVGARQHVDQRAQRVQPLVEAGHAQVEHLGRLLAAHVRRLAGVAVHAEPARGVADRAARRRGPRSRRRSRAPVARKACCTPRRGAAPGASSASQTPARRAGPAWHSDSAGAAAARDAEADGQQRRQRDRRGDAARRRVRAGSCVERRRRSAVHRRPARRRVDAEPAQQHAPQPGRDARSWAAAAARCPRATSAISSPSARRSERGARRRAPGRARRRS